MADIELVIKIPEESYEQIIEAGELDYLEVITAIENGISLPKGHGRLIDENELLKMTKSYKSELGRLKADPFVKCGIETVENFIKEISKIIEADKAKREDKE